MTRSRNVPSRGERRHLGAILALAALAAALSTATPASAHTVTHLVYDGSIDGSDAVGVTNPTFGDYETGVEKVEVDQGTDSLYVATRQCNEPEPEEFCAYRKTAGRIYKFNALTRASAPFSELAPSSVITGQSTGEASDMAVDNSGLETQGRIYALLEFSPVNLYLPGGKQEVNFPLESNAADICGDAVAPNGHLWLAFFGQGVFEYLPDGSPTGRSIRPQPGPFENVPEVCDFAIDSEENFYMPETYHGSAVSKYDSEGVYQYTLGSGTARDVTVDRSDDSVYLDEGGFVEHYDANGALLDEFGLPEGSYAGLQSESRGVAVDESSHTVFVVNRAVNPDKVDIFDPGPTRIAADATTDDPIVKPTSAVLRGTVNADGVPTTHCYFEWGVTQSYGSKLPCAEGEVFSDSVDHAVTDEVSGLTFGSLYHDRLVVENEEGLVSYGRDIAFNAQGEPVIKKAYVDELITESARVNAEIDPDQGRTKYRLEYGPDASYGTTAPIPDRFLESRTTTTVAHISLRDLTPGATYHYRVVATNLGGVAVTADHTFTTFPRLSVLTDECPNALARQQTSAELLPDCRSFELASADDTGGYNVESDLVPGETPYDGYQAVDGKLLYGVHNGGIPGTGSSTNRGVDPYLAVRSENAWTTRYVGIPADGTPSTVPFSSTLLGAGEDLNRFAFGGPDICSPCFADGSSGVPVTDGNGNFSQGMAGDLEPEPVGRSDGLIRQSISADGNHLVFGSIARFEEDGNDGTPEDISIYERDLQTGTTQVVSKTPAGTNLPCLQGAGACHSPGDGDGIAELAVSRDGSRVVVAQRVSTDADGSRYWHPYLHMGTNPQTIDLAPGAIDGVLFDGMTADGTKIFFTTRDQLSAQDEDSSADIYMDEIGAAGPAVPELVSSMSDGGPSNSDSCHPVAGWNTVAGGPNCDAVAFAGSAGVASGDGTFYFVSPELLDGAQGSENQVNLYVVTPGQPPQFVATMDSSSGKPGPPPPSRPIESRSLIAGLSRPSAMAVNDQSGDIYIQDSGRNAVLRFDETGQPDNFTEGSGAGTNALESESYPGSSQIAVDNHVGSPFENDLYVSDFYGLTVYSPTGKELGQLQGLNGCGVSVEQSTGAIYVGSYNGIRRLMPVSNSYPVTTADYVQTDIQPVGMRACQTGADSAGHVYGVGTGYQNFLNGFEASAFAPEPGPKVVGESISSDTLALAVDSETNELFADAGIRIKVFGALHEAKGSLLGGEISGSTGVAVNSASHHVYVAFGSQIIELGYVVHSSEPINNPAVVHAVHQPESHSYGDFQVSADGRYAIFPSAVSIANFDSFGHLEVYRYDTEAGATICASCAPTNSLATRDAGLPAHGNGLAADGRVFFNSTEPLVLRDTNGLGDAYEWKEGEVYLLSSGTSPSNSGLLSASEDGKDAYFFTREKMAPGGANGSLMRIYDAREGGGFFQIPGSPPCAASDECHGPGSKAAPPHDVGSLGGTDGNLAEGEGARCKRGFVKKHGRCVRKPHRKHSHHKHHGKRRAR
jgi:hypothetical protein